jgi:hypothetical protein
MLDGFKEEDIRWSFYAAKVRGVENPSVGQAMKGTESKEWATAIQNEVEQALFGTGTLVDTGRPMPHDAIKAWITMQLKKKFHPDGKVDKFKARGCLMGNMLEKGYAETYSPTIGALTYAIAQEIAVIDEMQSILVDTISAFLMQKYPWETSHLYVRFDPKVEQICNLPAGRWYQVRTYMYGLPDAGLAYYIEYSTLLVKQGYTRSKFDPCLFFRFEDEDRVYVWIHVDDTFVCASKHDMLSQFVERVETRYAVTKKESVENYVGVHYEKMDDGSVKLTQPKILDDLFVKHSITDRPSVKTPGSYPSNKPRDETPFDSTEFLGLLGSLLYVLKSRPDVGFNVSWAATKANNPTKEDWSELLRVLQYLYQTRTKGLILRKQQKGCALELFCYVDASYLLYPDSKSQTGFCLSFNDNGFFYTKSLKQTVVTTSSTHAEMRALFQLVGEILFVELICEELRRPVKQPAVIMEDNQAVVSLVAKDAGVSKGSKHFMMLVNYLREKVKEGTIDVRIIGTELNLADIETKNLFGQDFSYKRQRLLGQEPHEEEVQPVAKKLRANLTPLV